MYMFGWMTMHWFDKSLLNDVADCCLFLQFGVYVTLTDAFTPDR